MRRVKRGIVVGALVVGAVTPAGGYERLRTQGRRLSIRGDLLVVAAPERDRVGLFDVSSDAPRMLAEFGEQGLDPGFFMAPHGALALGDELVVADTLNQRLQAFDLTALRAGLRPALRRVVGKPGSRPLQFDGPTSGLAVSADAALDGLLFVADTGNDRIQVLDREWRFVRALGGRGAAPGRLDRPSAIAFDPSGRVLYASEERNRRVSAFDARSGAALFTFAGCEGEPLAMPAGLAVGPAGDVLVTDRVRRRLVRLRPDVGPDGAPRALRCAGGFGRSGAGPGEWQYPQAVAVDGRGRVYVCDQADDRCQAFSADGRFLGAFADAWRPPEWTAPPAPARPDAGGTHALCSGAGAFGLRVTTDPSPVPLNQPFDLLVGVSRGCSAGAPAEGVELRVDGWMPEHRHGMTTQPRVTPVAPGRWRVEGALLHMAGLWELHFDLWRDTLIERAQWELEIE